MIEKFMENKGIYRAYIPTISYTITPESYTDFFCAVSSLDSSELFYLQPSPEFYLKKIIAIEQQSFYYLGPVYRAAEPQQSPLHLPEFDMLEFYKIDCDYENFILLCKNFFEMLWSETFPHNYSLHGQKFLKESIVISWAELFQEIKISMDDIRQAVKEKKQKKLRSYLQDSEDFEICFYKIFYQELEHKIRDGRLWFLSLYPKELGALANVRSNGTAERFEIFWNGIEVMNSYGESSNEEFMRKIMEHENNLRQQFHKPFVKIDEQFLQCLPKLPGILSGGSIGLDRVLYILIGEMLEAKKVQDLSLLYFGK